MRADGAAFGKLILLGEHAVVHGVPALVCGIGRTLRATAAHSEEGPSRIELLAKRCATTADDPLARAFCALLAEDPPSAAPVAVRVEGDLPAGMGLGFSAAAAVATARAVSALSGETSDETVRARAMAWERVFHGNPSGVDVAAAMHGGFLRFSKAAGVTRIAPRNALLLCVGLTGAPASTKRMVEGVAAQRRDHAQTFDKTLGAIEALVDNAQSAIEAGSLEALGQLMDLNHMLLAGWLLSTQPLEALCAAARRAGALGAKLTGSGGGGAMVALAGADGQERAHDSAERIVAAWRALGYDGFCVSVGAG